MTATPVGIYSASPADLRAISFNYLSGQLWVNDIGKSATWMVNAVSRMAVDILGGPLPDGTILLGGLPDLVANPANTTPIHTYLQMFRPIILSVNSFFKTAGANAVQPGVPFGNRLSLMSWSDTYDNPQHMYKIANATATLNSFVFDNAENAFSVPPRGITCYYDFVIAPDVAGVSGNWTDFLGASLAAAVNNTGGWLRMRVTYGASLQSVVGWFSQYLGTFGGGDYLVGQGRTQSVTAATILTTDGGGVTVTPKTTNDRGL